MWQHRELQNDGALGRDNGAGGQSLQPLTSQTLSSSPSAPRRGSPSAAALKEMQCCCCCSSSSSSCWYSQVYIRRGGAEKLHFLHRVVHFCESSLTGRCLRQPVQTTAKARRMWKGGGLTLCARHHIWTLVTAGPYQGIHDQVYLDTGPRQCGTWYLRLNVMRTYFSVQLLLDMCVPSLERLQTVQPVQILVILHLDKIKSASHVNALLIQHGSFQMNGLHLQRISALCTSSPCTAGGNKITPLDHFWKWDEHAALLRNQIPISLAAGNSAL